MKYKSRNNEIGYRVWIFGGLDNGARSFMDDVRMIDFEEEKVYWTQFTEYSYFDECVLMQYLGVRDINKKKIFEGDILKTNEAGWIGKVVYGRDTFYLIDNQGGFSSGVEWEKCEVIGNIYENKKLLK